MEDAASSDQKYENEIEKELEREIAILNENRGPEESKNGLHFKLSPASEASREVANLTERKNLHTPVYGVKEFVCLSVHL